MCGCGCGIEFADHAAAWRRRGPPRVDEGGGYDGCLLKPVVRRDHSRRKRDGAVVWLVRNPELCVRAEAAPIQSVHFIDLRTVRGPDYDPSSRTTRIVATRLDVADDGASAAAPERRP